MRFLLFAVLCTSILQPTGQQDTEGDRTSRDLRQRAEEWRNAYNRNDAPVLTTFYTDDAEYISPHVTGLLIRGKEKLLENFRLGASMGGHVDSVKVLTIGSSCDLAYMVCSYVATNNGVKVSGKNVLVLKKVKGHWLITTHASVVRD
jgi:ketosteroid isomerase-like protein